MPTVSVIIPAYNEAATIISVLRAVNEQKIDGVTFEIVVVDDGSSDGTDKQIADNPDLYQTSIRLDRNSGKGAAVKAGIKSATGDYILFQDADLEYTPTQYVDLLAPVLKHNADIVMGSRMLGGRASRVHYFWHKVGNKLITLIFNVINNTTFSDIYSCYLLYRRNLFDPDDLITSGWEQQAEILSRAIGPGKGIYFETPIEYNGRSYSEGKKIRAIHTISVVYAIIRFSYGKARRPANKQDTNS
jgi:glycosyltransferase involved in cell wall biosynthesis